MYSSPLQALDRAIMAAAIEQIEQEITALRVKASQLALEAHRAYQEYVTVLGRSLSQQLILAVYHLCTQAYPQAFLGLSLMQRQTLQADLQQLGQQLQLLLQEHWENLVQPQADEILDPDDVLQSWEDLETAIMMILRQTSRQANQLLQAQDILEIASIDMLFDIAAKAEDAGRSVTSTPHVLKALIETKDTEESEGGPVVAIYLQLADIEFSDTEVMGWRHQLRPLWQQLKALQADFEVKQQDKVVAEAEAAWRASWQPID